MAFVSSVIVLIYALFAILAYIPFCIGLYNIAVRQEVRLPWLVFVPLVNLYLLGLFLRKLTFRGTDIPAPQLVLPLAFVLLPVLNQVPVVGFLYSAAVYGLCVLAAYRLFWIYKRDSARLFTALSLIPLIGSFLVLIVSRYEPDYQ